MQSSASQDRSQSTNPRSRQNWPSIFVASCAKSCAFRKWKTVSIPSSARRWRHGRSKHATYCPAAALTLTAPQSGRRLSAGPSSTSSQSGSRLASTAALSHPIKPPNPTSPWQARIQLQSMPRTQVNNARQAVARSYRQARHRALRSASPPHCLRRGLRLCRRRRRRRLASRRPHSRRASSRRS